ncbi:MAG: hypothetical protein EZS28_043168, partial [Streblomastix strix]
MQSGGTGLDGLFEIDDEVEDALTIPRSDGTQKLEDNADLTNFAMIFQVERNDSSGVTFDGLNIKGQNISISLKANPIYQGAADVYCATNPIPPILITVSDTYWLFSALNGGTTKVSLLKYVDGGIYYDVVFNLLSLLFRHLSPIADAFVAILSIYFPNGITIELAFRIGIAYDGYTRYNNSFT